MLSLLISIYVAKRSFILKRKIVGGENSGGVHEEATAGKNVGKCDYHRTIRNYSKKSVFEQKIDLNTFDN